MGPLVSIIVPVYNIEQYVSSCLDSLEKQSYRNIEIIIIDDGSTDNSYAVCSSFASVSKRRVELIQQSNAGLSAARNTGIVHSEGEYLVFVDGDDIVSSLYIESLLRCLIDSGCSMATMRGGMSFFEAEELVLEDDRDKAFEYEIIDEIDYQQMLLYQQAGNGAPWRIYARPLVDINFFPRGLFYEDLATTYRYVHNKGPVALLSSKGLYGYRQRRGSIMRGSYSPQKVASALDITSQLYNDISTWYPSLKQAASSRCFSVNRLVFAEFENLHNRDVDPVWSMLVKHRLVVLRDGNARKRERVAALFACMGKGAFRCFCMLYRLYKERH